MAKKIVQQVKKEEKPVPVMGGDPKTTLSFAVATSRPELLKLIHDSATMTPEELQTIGETLISRNDQIAALQERMAEYDQRERYVNDHLRQISDIAGKVGRNLREQKGYIDTRPGRNEPHLDSCPSRHAGECDCGKAERESEDDPDPVPEGLDESGRDADGTRRGYF